MTWRRFGILFLIDLAISFAFGADPAQAIPVAVIAGILSVGATSAIAIIATFVVNAVITFGLSTLFNAVFGPSLPDRQAQVTTLAIGENPRVAIFGRAAVGGTLCDATYTGGQYGDDWNIYTIAIADHQCDALEAFYVNDQLITFTSSGVVAGGFAQSDNSILNFNGQLEVYWFDGSATSPQSVTSSAGGWTVGNIPSGVATIVVGFKVDAPNASNPVWSAGRPNFLWVVRGKRCYDPRLDSTVGGSGTQRWSVPSTWTWTENPSVCRYNWVRGIFAYDSVNDPTMLLIGRGLSDIEAPEANMFAYANLCDETVYGYNGATQKRYTIGCVVKSNEAFNVTEKMFADAVGGIVIQPNGAVEVEPGAARSVSVSITDDNLLSGSNVVFGPFRSTADNAWINTVVAHYVEPTQKWQEHSAPIRRVAADVTSDGGAREDELSLHAVTNGGQAQRVAEIKRRLGRLQRTATITLGPRFSYLQEGDWITWTSARHTSGQPVTFRIESYTLDQKWQITLSMREINAAVYTWTSTDQAADLSLPATTTMPVGWNASYTYNQSLLSNTAITLDPTTGALNGIGTGSGTPVVNALLVPSISAAAVTASWSGVSSKPSNVAALTGSEAINNATLAAPGANRVAFSLFEAGVYPWSISAYGSTYGGALTTAASGAYNDLIFTCTFTGASQFQSIIGKSFPVTAGEQLAIQARLSTNGNCTVIMCLSFSTGASPQVLPTAGISTPSDYLFQGMSTVPTGATSAYMTLYIYSTGASAARATLAQPFVCGVPTGQTTYPAFAPGPNSYDAADVTAQNTAAAIANQGSLATQSNVNLATQVIGTLAVGNAAAGLVNANVTPSTLTYTGGATVQSLQPAQAGADVTSSHTAAAVVGQGALATQNTVDLSLADGTSGGVKGKKTSYLTDDAGLGTTAAWSGVSSKPSNIAALSGSETINNATLAGQLTGGSVVPAVSASITGQGPLATSSLTASQVTNSLLATPGANRVAFSLFEAGVYPWSISAYGSTYGGALTTAASGAYNDLIFTCTFTGASQFQSIIGKSFPVTAGEQLAIQARLSTNGNCAVIMCLSFSTGASPQVLPTAGIGTPSDYLFQGMSTVPTGATSAYMTLYIYSTGASAARATLAQPFVCGVPTGQTTYPAFAPGPNSYDAADVTASNIAAAISRQAATATNSDYSAVTGAKPPTNADNTALNQHSISASASVVNFSADYTGALLAGQINQTVQMYRTIGSTDYTSSTTWAATATSGNTVSISSGGVLSFSGTITTGSVTVTGTYGGITLSYVIQITKTLGAAPTGGAGSTSATVTSFSPTTTGASTYGSANTTVMTLQCGSSGQINLSASTDFYVNSNSYALRAAYGKWQWRVSGGTWADVGSEVESSVSARGITSDLGHIDIMTNKSGLTSGTNYDFQLLLRSATAVSGTALYFDSSSATAAQH